MATSRFTALAGTLSAAVALASAVSLSPASASSADRPNSQSAARHAAVSPSGKWLHEALSSDSDQDWFRFRVGKAGRALVTLGQVAGDYSLTVFDARGHRVASSDRSGQQFEEIYAKVSVGDYYVRVAANSGAKPNVDYVLKFRRLPNRVLIVEQKDAGDVNGFDVHGELLNNTGGWKQLLRLHITWIDSKGNALGTTDEGIRPGPIAPHQRAEFTIDHAHAPSGDIPAGATSYRIRVDSSKTKARTPSGLVMKPSGNGTPGSQHSRVYSGTLTNNTGKTLTQVYPTVIEYDSRGRANDFGYDHIKSMAPGDTISYKIFAGDRTTPAPNSFRVFTSITGS